MDDAATVNTSRTPGVRSHGDTPDAVRDDGRRISDPPDGVRDERPRVDGDRFERLVAEHQARIARLVGRFLGNPDDVEDVVQDVFLKALRKLDGFRGDSKAGTWLAAIAVNRCRSIHRRRALRRRLMPWVAVSEAREDAAVEVAETGERVRRAVRSLPTKYREPIVLRYFEGMEVAEIAEILGLAVNAVEVRLSRARKSLNERLRGP